jgi:phytol kinase
MNPILATVLTLAAALLFLRLMDFIAHKGLITSRLSRKIIHIGTGPIFVLCWLMFPDVWYARYLAALVPGMITVQFALTGLGVIKDEASVKAMSRSGDPKEILRGPLYYGIMFVALTILFWKDHPAGVVALMVLCGGDGIADLVGRGIPSPKLPWSPKKSLAGTLSVFLGGLALALVVLWAFEQFGVFSGAYAKVGVLALIALLAAAVESLPFSDVDNITITIVAALLGWLWL